jgi:DNA-binding NarL/FixJ family response regulator
MKVLIVDDSDAVRDRISKLVGEILGIEPAIQAADFERALEAFDQAAPQLVVLDIGLPTRSGLELLPILKKRVPAPIVIVLTNHAGLEYAKRCEQLGADYFFDKSTQFQAAIEIIRAARFRPQLVGATPTTAGSDRPTNDSPGRR